jgi:predicted RNA methylase
MAPRPKKLSEKAIEVLGSMEVIGNQARIMAGQLDRPLYLEVNAALEALGGKWDKKSKTHLFDGNPLDALDQVVVDGEFSNEVRDFEFFETPPEVTSKLLGVLELKPGDLVLEPSCGDGALIGAVLTKEPKVEVQAYEARDTAAKKTQERFASKGVKVKNGNFLDEKPNPRFKFVVMNPPFGRQADIDHVLHAHGFLKAKGKLVAVMSASVKFRTNRKTVEFRDFVESHGGSIEPLPTGSFKSSGTNVNTCLVMIPRN